MRVHAVHNNKIISRYYYSRRKASFILPGPVKRETREWSFSIAIWKKKKVINIPKRWCIYMYAMHLQCSLFRQNTPAVGITCAPTGNRSVLHKILLGIYAEREKNSNESTTNIIFCLKMI